MAIPDTQLQTWAHQGAVQSSEATHKSIRAALASYEPLQRRDYEVFLQGSYRNATNIYGESDVDVVAQLNSSFQYNLLNLTEGEQQQFQRDFPSAATYTWSEFRKDVLAALVRYYGPRLVKEGKKCIKVLRDGNRLDADVVVCMQYRNYQRYTYGARQFVEGMTSYVPSETRWVVNYPKEHIRHGSDKNSATRDWFKPTVRMFKNARARLVDDHIIERAVAPSYFIECLVYNAPNEAFGGTWQQAYYDVLCALSRIMTTNSSWCVCVNEMVYLFGNTPEQWSTYNAITFLAALHAQWDNWR